jgi:tetratricopeptide (TPR) repeat protein
MQQLKPFLDQVRALLARNEFDAALQQLHTFLENSPLLDEVLQQSGRWKDVRKQIRMGTVDLNDIQLTTNQIRAGLLGLLQEIEQSVVVASGRTDTTALRLEMERAATITNGKNFNTGSVSSGRDTQFGDRYETHHHYGERKIPRILTQTPFLPDVFFGRENDLQRIHDLLFGPGDNLLLLVNGDGGVGKTSVASKYFHQYQHEYAHVAWVLSEKSITNALLLLALPLGVSFDERMGAEARLDMLLQEMANLQKPCLLVLDNANELDDLEAHYLRLRRCSNFHLLLTTRIRAFEHADTYPIEGLPEKEALEMFQKHYRPLQPEERALFLQIREAVGGNTLVLELFAKNLARLNKIRQHYALADLLADLQQKGLLQLSQTKEVRTGYQSRDVLRHEKPEIIIAAMYDLGDLSAEEVALLSVFAVLPAESIPFSRLEVLLAGTEELEDRLVGLAQKGWIGLVESREADLGGDSSEEVHFKCSPVVQEVVRVKNGKLQEDCQMLIVGLIQSLDREKLHEKNYRFSNLYVCYAEAMLMVLNRPDYNLGIICQNIGKFYTDTGRLDKALRSYEKLFNIFSSIILSDPKNTEFKHGLAVSYQYLGNTYTALGDLYQALTFFEHETHLLEELYEFHPQNIRYKNQLAVSYYYIGSTYSSLGNLERALIFFEKDIEISKELYISYPHNGEFKNGLAASYEKLGSTHIALGNLGRALTYFEHYNQFEKDLYEAYPQKVEFKNNLAISYEKLGDIHSALGNADRALTYFEHLNQLFEKLYEAYPQNVSFKNGLAISYEKLGDTHSALGNLDRALTYFEQRSTLSKELYETYPQNVSFKNGLAISYAKLGEINRDHLSDRPKAKAWFQQAEVLWVELVRDAPQYAQFQKFLGIVQQVLGVLE